MKESSRDFRESLDDEKFIKFFESKDKITSEESQMMKNMKNDIALTSPSGFVPIYHAPKDGGPDMLEKTILSNIAKSVIYSFIDIPQTEMSRYGGKSDFPKPQVVFLHGGIENRIIPTHETEAVISELKNPKPKEQPKKKSPISRFLKL